MGSQQMIPITGALTGFGRATAVAVAQQGARVVVSGRHERAVRALVDELRGGGTETEFIQADVRQDAAVRDPVDNTVARFGRLDVVVNNAGTEGTPGSVAEQTGDSYAGTFGTNVFGTILGMKHALRVMVSQGQGSIVNVSSTMGHKGALGASMYTVSKYAVEGLTKSAALEGAVFGVRVNAIALGPVETGMLNRLTGSKTCKARLIAGVPTQRAGWPEEIAQAVVFLASDMASFVAGQILSVDGGKSAA